ncbi:putative aTP-dependent helicase [Mycobacterium xenopi 4042]|uniref:Putative aTP-dependent helicase n=1 Tax=Mycobacterium xenopi 4042 TaxID=1299334 RepID=X8CKJ8_MYCXE|nr:putative aTP-dependent helicase [Mycobacterium xenopi 4042]
MGRDVQRLTAWASTTDTGDRDDVKPGVATGRGARQRVGAGMPGRGPLPVRGQCFAERAWRAGAADLVVTNHALLPSTPSPNRQCCPITSSWSSTKHTNGQPVTAVVTAELSPPRWNCPPARQSLDRF